jgi:branched-chain amino acid transport system permease protein
MNIKFKIAILIAFALSLPYIIGKPYITHLLVICCIYSMLAISLNLAAGVLGQVSLGHAAIYGIGAYTAAILSLKFGANLIITLPIGSLLAASVSIIITSPAIKISGTYLTMITLGLNEITRLILLNWNSLTRGPNGMPGIPTASLFGFLFDNSMSYYFLVLFIMIFEIVIIQKLISSRIGDSFIAIKGDEIAAASLGINIAKTKIYIIAKKVFLGRTLFRSANATEFKRIFFPLVY